MKILLVLSAIISVIQAVTYRFPEESDKHEGTWLQWPHDHQHGEGYAESVEISWIEMTEALQAHEKVHIIAYDDKEKKRIIDILEEKGVPLNNVDFKIYPTDDVWVRDNGPIFVEDDEGRVLIEDWGFNGWGGKHEFENCDKIPQLIGKDLGIKVIDVDMVNEGGSVESDGKGVLMACRSSVISQNKTAEAVRNEGITQEEADEKFKTYYGVKKVIWLDGVVGQDITDFHIDGFMKFINHTTMITFNEDDLLEWGVSDKDINTLYTATNAEGKEYKKLYIPLTKENAKLANGTSLGFKGSYANFYVANNVVLVPNYDDDNDEVANNIIQAQYPGRKVKGINVRNLYENGGMVHCVTQQQPAEKEE